MALRVAIYSRFSTDLQNAASAADQTRACRRFAEGMGWQVVGTYEDQAMSGASRFRPEFLRLLADSKGRKFDVVLCEALDRMGRKLADIADMFDQLSFQGIALHTMQQGLITAMHIGLLGTMSQLALADIKAKTQRGLRAVAEDGRSAGGICYGYRAAATDPSRPDKRGLRAIDAAEARIVVQIFEGYANGLSPKIIARNLNQAGVPGPRGGAWGPSAIYGNRAQGTGVINNEMYIGRQIWGRRTWIKDPSTGRRVARDGAPDARVVSELPELRIVSDELWNAARARQSVLDKGREGRAVTEGPAPFWSKQRPRYIFSGLMRCGACGGGYSKISATHFGCSTARNKGETACGNLLTIRRDVLEGTVLDALRERLMDPDLFKSFVQGFTEVWNRGQAEAVAGLAGKRAELAKIGMQIERLVDALAEGTPASAVRGRMETLDARRQVLEAELANAQLPAPRLHPNLAEVYRQRMAQLAEVLAEDDNAEAREVVRGLVEMIRLVPEGGRLRIEVRGELGGILRFADPETRKRPGSVAEAFLSQVKGDAGTGFEPVTFRL